MIPSSSLDVHATSDEAVQTRKGQGGGEQPTHAPIARCGKPRTILFVTATDGYGGSEKHLIELVRRLPRSESRPVILCTKADPYTERLKRSRAVQVAVMREAALKSWRDWYRVFRKIRPDVAVFIQGVLRAFPWYAYVGARMAGIRRLYAIQHATPPPLPPREDGRSMRSIVHRLIGRRARFLMSSRLRSFLCNATICVSNAVRNSLVGDYRFPANKTLTIHNGVSLEEFDPSHGNGAWVRAKLGLRAEDFVLVCSARLSKEKGVDILLKAMSRLVGKGMHCKCIILGDGQLRGELLEQVRILGMTRDVFMEGFQEDTRPYLLAANAFVLTSYQEGLPVAVLEAMACGLPCVVTNVGGNLEAVNHKVEGLVINSGSVDEVVDAVSYLLTHPLECARMSRMAQARMREVFDIEARMADVMRIILN